MFILLAQHFQFLVFLQGSLFDLVNIRLIRQKFSQQTSEWGPPSEKEQTDWEKKKKKEIHTVAHLEPM